ncbi:hypothetical protein B0H19DRAFT_1258031 [Mycena capillaripes]|nr:hypothetical protein B0H19DRAFT_1258031 [Mycena capillaripes]
MDWELTLCLRVYFWVGISSYGQYGYKHGGGQQPSWTCVLLDGSGSSCGGMHMAALKSKQRMFYPTTVEESGSASNLNLNKGTGESSPESGSRSVSGEPPLPTPDPPIRPPDPPIRPPVRPPLSSDVPPAEPNPIWTDPRTPHGTPHVIVPGITAVHYAINKPCATRS